MKNILPIILEKITGHKRYKVDNFQWSKTYITYDLFRIWEKIFWRRVGKSNNIGDTIRIESQTEFWYDENNKKHIKRTFYTKEAVVVFAEGLVHEFVKNFVKDIKKIIGNWKWQFDRFIPQLGNIFGTFQPQFVFDGFYTVSEKGLVPKGYSFAIAYDTGTDGNGTKNTSPDQFNHTCSGSNRLLCILAYTTTTAVSGVTYNSVSMSDLGTSNSPGLGHRQAVDMQILVNPASGTNQVSISASQTVGGVSASYSGCKQTSQPDSSAIIAHQSSGTSFTCTTTVVAANSWLILAESSTRSDVAAGTGTYKRVGFDANYGPGFFDSNGGVGTGSQSLVVTCPGSTEFGGVLASISPSPESGPANLKTWNGLAKASIKTIDGLAIASVKTVDGLA